MRHHRKLFIACPACPNNVEGRCKQFGHRIDSRTAVFRGCTKQVAGVK